MHDKKIESLLDISEKMTIPNSLIDKAEFNASNVILPVIKMERHNDEWAILLKMRNEELAKLQKENAILKDALVTINAGCPTKAKGCLCLQNVAAIAISGNWKIGGPRGEEKD